MNFMQYIEQNTTLLPWTGCRIWVQAVTCGGYGRSAIAQKLHGTTIVHRAVYQELFGITDASKYVCHYCDVPSCCNPEHLFLGTPTDNAQDRKNKGRSAPKYGEFSGKAKLKRSDIPNIWALLKSGVIQKDIAKIFGVSQGTISRINRNDGWRNL